MTSLKNTTKPAIRWPQQLTTPSELMQCLQKKSRLQLIKSPLSSKFVLQIVGTWSYLIANVFNTSRVFNFDTFRRELEQIEVSDAGGLIEPCQTNSTASATTLEKVSQAAAPLLTYSNHISCIDDPIIWSPLLPFTYYARKTESVRWSPAATEICFSRPWHSSFFALGKTFPITRGAGLDQPAMDFAVALLKCNQWLHLFPEGRVMRDSNQQPLSNKDRGYIFKWGIAHLILNYFKNSESTNQTLRILPFYHLGMDEILPIGWPYIPRFGRKITIYIRPKVIIMDQDLLSDILSRRMLRSDLYQLKSDDDIERIKVTNFLEEEMEKLVETTERLHKVD